MTQLLDIQLLKLLNFNILTTLCFSILQYFKSSNFDLMSDPTFSITF